jgi:hypothetical protein
VSASNVVPLDCGLSKPQLLQQLRKARSRLLGMMEIAKALSESDIEFAQETFMVFADNLDGIAAEIFDAVNGTPGGAA